MKFRILGLIGIMVAALASVSWASRTGYGIAQPVAHPVSVREGSTDSNTQGRGHHRTRFFIGGGMHYGK